MPKRCINGGCDDVPKATTQYSIFTLSCKRTLNQLRSHRYTRAGAKSFANHCGSCLSFHGDQNPPFSFSFAHAASTSGWPRSGSYTNCCNSSLRRDTTACVQRINQRAIQSASGCRSLKHVHPGKHRVDDLLEARVLAEITVFCGHANARCNGSSKSFRPSETTY